MLDIEGERGRYDIVTWDLEPGDVYVFNATVSYTHLTLPTKA